MNTDRHVFYNFNVLSSLTVTVAVDPDKTDKSWYPSHHRVVIKLFLPNDDSPISLDTVFLRRDSHNKARDLCRKIAKRLDMPYRYFLNIFKMSKYEIKFY